MKDINESHLEMLNHLLDKGYINKDDYINILKGINKEKSKEIQKDAE